MTRTRKNHDGADQNARDTRPVTHDGTQEATDDVLRDMAATDAYDDFDEE